MKNHPDFIICGAAKSGTTTLFSWLSQHPNICMPKLKEIDHFSVDQRYERGLDSYISYFKNCKKDSLWGEASPNYIYIPQVAGRIACHYPKIKLLFVLRNPVDRAFSQFRHKVRDNIERLDFEEALESEKERLLLGFRERLEYSYLDRGYYFRQLKEYYKLFEFDQIKIIKFEAMIADMKKTFTEICDWLGMDSDFLPKDRSQKNPAAFPKNECLHLFLRRGGGKYRELVKKMIPRRMGSSLKQKLIQWNLKPAGKSGLSPSLRKLLIGQFETDIRNLESLTNISFSDWFPGEVES